MSEFLLKQERGTSRKIGFLKYEVENDILFEEHFV